MTHATGNAFLGFAFAYGGLAQLLAAMWEFRNRNVFGATGFGTFGAFWIGLGLWVLLVVNPAVAAIRPATVAATVTAINHELGWILLGFGIFTLYATILITQTNMALFIDLPRSCSSPSSSWHREVQRWRALAPHSHDQDRRLPRRGHRARRLVHLGGRHGGRHGRQAQAARGPGADQMTIF